MQKKVDKGAEWFQTQAVYDEKVFSEFIEKAVKFGKPIQLGVVVLKSPQMGKFMNQNVSGITVPDSWINEIGSVVEGDRKKKAAEMMGRFIRKIKSMVHGVHIMPLGWTDSVPQILEYAEIKVDKS